MGVRSYDSVELDSSNYIEVLDDESEITTLDLINVSSLIGELEELYEVVPDLQGSATETASYNDVDLQLNVDNPQELYELLTGQREQEGLEEALEVSEFESSYIPGLNGCVPDDRLISFNYSAGEAPDTEIEIGII